MSSSRGVTRVAMAAGLLGVLAAVGGCTGSSAGSGPSTTTSAGTSAGPVSNPPAPSEATIKNDPAARKAIAPAVACVATSSGWKASGRATNSGAKPATYTIVISFTTKASTVLARGTTTVTVKAGATKRWTAQASFARTRGVQCVLRGVSKS